MDCWKRNAKKLALILVVSLCLSLLPPSIGSASFVGGGSSAGGMTVTSAVYTVEIDPNPVVLVPGAEQIFQAKVYDANGDLVAVTSDRLNWSADSAIGAMTGNRLHAVEPVTSGFKYGYVRAEYHGAIGEALVLVGKVAVVFEDFESVTHNGKTILSAGKIRSTSSSIELVTRPEPVMYGERSVKLAYDLTTVDPENDPGSSAVYVSLRNLDTGALDRPIEGTPKKIGLWVYGSNNNHWLRVRLRDKSTSAISLDLTTTTSFTWNGWKYVTVDIPSTYQEPFTFMDVYLVETNESKKDTGVVYFDRLSLFYTNTNIFGVDIVGLTPMKVGETKTAEVRVTKKDSTAPEPVNSGITFLSSHPDIASVNSSGEVTALKAGKTTIVALYADAQPALFELEVTDDAPVVQTLDIYGPASIEAGRQGTAAAFAKFAALSDKLDVSREAVWSSSNPSVAQVSVGPDGIVQIAALSEGTTQIKASYGGREATHALTVTPPVPVLHSIKLDNTGSMLVGETRQIKVLGEYHLLDQPYETVEITDPVTFASSNKNVAEIDANGIITAKAVGASLITASYQGKTANYVVVVLEATEAPKRELRAAWIATVENIDWPKQGASAEDQQQAFIDLLDGLAETGINAIVVQIKPTADAFYPSEYAPWSHWLTGEQGKDPGYDPLAFMIEEAKKRNMEFHAWFNPYRVSMDTDINKLVPTHIARQRPDWVVSYGGKLYFNPGNPETREYIIDTIMEVVKKYDIDAVHFDDYFYPYPVSGVDFPDEDLYQQYKGEFNNKADWRRNNVNTLIQRLSKEIKKEKPHVQFGISPFGIWRNKSTDSRGSDTNGLQSYDAVFADTRLWVENEWIDYIAPQVYWYFSYGPAAYENLIDWWTQQTKGKNVKLYIGHAAYRVGSEDPNWQDPDQLPNQVLFNRSYEGVDGSIFFATNNLLANPLGIKDRMQNDLFRYPALAPHFDWFDVPTPAAPERLKAYSLPSGVRLIWEDSSNETAYYVIYRVEGEGQTPDTDDPKQILDIVPKLTNTARQTYTDVSADPSKAYSYGVTAVNRVHGESAPSGSASPVEPGPPSWDNGVMQADNVTTTGLTLTWSGARDELEITGYRIYQDGKLLTTVSGDTGQYQVTGLSPDTEYAFKVEAGNAAGKWSADGPSVKVKTQKASGGSPNPPSPPSTPPATPNPPAENPGDADEGEAPDDADDDADTPSEDNGTPAGEKPAAFADTSGHWAETSIHRAVELNFVNGYTDGTFRPNRPVTRAEFVTMLARALKWQNAGSATGFTDEERFGAWAKQAIAQAVELGVLNGYADGSFRPDQPITRAEMAVILARALQLSMDADVTSFADHEDIPSWAVGAVEALREMGLLQGRGKNRFAPNEVATRAEAITVILRFLEMQFSTP